jgi:hypothetical protein
MFSIVDIYIQFINKVKFVKLSLAHKLFVWLRFNTTLNCNLLYDNFEIRVHITDYN